MPTSKKPSGKKPVRVAADEFADWHAEVATVDKLGKPKKSDTRHPRVRAAHHESPQFPPRFIERHADDMPNPLNDISNPSKSAYCTTLSLTPERIAGIAPHIEANVLKNLSKGAIPPTADIDLHGLTSPEAYQEITHWIYDAFHNDHRCLLVITGKGRGTMGAIKSQLPQWLNNNPHVLAYHTALPKHGGTGALYIYLRRYK